MISASRSSLKVGVVFGGTTFNSAERQLEPNRGRCRAGWAFTLRRSPACSAARCSGDFDYTHSQDG